MNSFEFTQEIQAITNQLIDKYHPQKVILFGSSSINRFDPEKSDLDFLIIKESVPVQGRSRIYELDKLINYRIAADFIVYTPNELKSLLEAKDPFVTSILKEGKTLYEQ
jgi:uncharacterized protein